MNKIPEKMAYCDKYHSRAGSMTDKIRRLNVGDYTIFPIEKRTSVDKLAKQIGYRITTRQMGSDDTFRCYRID